MSSGFITETELDEVRKKRQEEWEKVRQPDQPLERPEEPQDNRSLFDRLKEQKMKKDLEFEEAHKLKNLIRGLDDDEVEFLEFVDRNKMKAEKQQKIEEQKELEEFRQSVASLKEKSDENRILLETSITKIKSKLSNHGLIGSGSNRLSQKSILKSGIVIRKRKNGENENSNSTENDNDTTAVSSSKKQKHENEQNNEDESQKQQDESMNTKQKEQHKNNDVGESAESKILNGNDDSIIGTNQKIENCSEKLTPSTAENVSSSSSSSLTPPPVLLGSFEKGALKCIGILPGIGKYDDSSDSEVSTDSEEEVELPTSLSDLVANIMQNKKMCQDDDE